MSGYLNLYQNLPGPWTTRWFCVYFGVGSILWLPTSPSAYFTGRTLHSHIPQTWLCVFLEKGCSHPGYLNSTHAASVFFWTCSKFPRQSQQPAPSRLLEMLRFSRSSKLQYLIILSAEALEIQISWCAESPLLTPTRKLELQQSVDKSIGAKMSNTYLPQLLTCQDLLFFSNEEVADDNFLTFCFTFYGPND